MGIKQTNRTMCYTYVDKLKSIHEEIVPTQDCPDLTRINREEIRQKREKRQRKRQNKLYKKGKLLGLADKPDIATTPKKLAKKRKIEEVEESDQNDSLEDSLEIHASPESAEIDSNPESKMADDDEFIPDDAEM